MTSLRKGTEEEFLNAWKRFAVKTLLTIPVTIIEIYILV